jgi:PEP-CTERM motif
MRFFPRGLALTAAMFVSAASAAPIVLTFEGTANMQPIGNYYNGGSGTNYGISFSEAAHGLVDQDAGGGGNIANEPSPNTVMVFLNINNTVLNYSAGFTTGLSFFYSAGRDATARVYDGLNGTGNLLGTLSLPIQYNGNACSGDPTGLYCNWTEAGLAFSGVARSIDFSGTENFVAFDNITLGSTTAVAPVPEPTTFALMAMGLAGVGFAARRRKA